MWLRFPHPPWRRPWWLGRAFEILIVCMDIEVANHTWIDTYFRPPYEQYIRHKMSTLYSCKLECSCKVLGRRPRPNSYFKKWTSPCKHLEPDCAARRATRTKAVFNTGIPQDKTGCRGAGDRQREQFLLTLFIPKCEIPRRECHRSVVCHWSEEFAECGHNSCVVGTREVCGTMHTWHLVWKLL